MEMIALQPELCPALPVVLGNVDYSNFKKTLERIDQLLSTSGIEATFVRNYLVAGERQMRAEADQQQIKSLPPSEKVTITRAEHAVRALRCNIARALEGSSCREFSRRLADSPLLQSFCGINRMDTIRVPSKSALDRYSRIVPEEIVRMVVDRLTQAVATNGNDPGNPLDLVEPLSLDALFLDSTCVTANIHFPVDWILLRDAARTLLKAVAVVRRHGLRNRMNDPAVFIKAMNRLCIEMSNIRRRKDSRKLRKQVLRLMKKLLKRINLHARRHRDLLAQYWEQSDLKEGAVRQILARIDRIRAQLPAAIKQAHERIIGDRKVANADKILSLYESEIHVIVRGKSGAEVEFGNSLLLAELPAGVIVDWALIKDCVPSDSKLIATSLERFSQVSGGKLPGAVVTDRGFDSPQNRKLLATETIFNAICPKSPRLLRERMQEDRFAQLQTRRGQTEARIAIFKNGFLGRPMRSKGFGHRELNIAWSVLAHNLWVIARLPILDEKQVRFKRAA